LNIDPTVWRFELPLYVPAFTTIKDSLSSKGFSTKGPYIKELQLGIHKTGVHSYTNSTLYTRGSIKPIEVTEHLVI